MCPLLANKPSLSDAGYGYLLQVMLIYSVWPIPANKWPYLASSNGDLLASNCDFLCAHYLPINHHYLMQDMAIYCK